MIREDPIGRYLLHAMSVLPTPFARLVFLASLRDHYTGQYVHEGWAGASSPEAVSAALKQMHGKMFEVVAILPLVDLCREIRNHFESLGEEELQTVNFWLETEPYHEMIPVGYPLLARKLFISQIRLSLEILLKDPDWRQLQESAASRPQLPAPERPLHWIN